MWLQAGRNSVAARAARGAAEAAGAPVHEVSRAALDALLPGCKHQGVAVRVVADSMPDTRRRALEDLPADALLLVLDGVQDPHNLGACLRTAEAAGAHAVVVPRHRAVGLTPAVRKVACGAAERVPLVVVSNLARSLDALRAAGVEVVGADARARCSLYQAPLAGALALVLGGEARGLRRLTREHCARVVSIPMPAPAESLNVSVAAGVMLFEARRQRLAGEGLSA